jgi:hypothetical protein
MIDFLTSPVPWVVLFVVGSLIVLRATPLAETVAVLLRLLAIALPVGLVFSAPIAFVVNSNPIPDTLRPALIAALVVVSGWVVTFLFQELGRSQDQTDLMLALRAEIHVIRGQVDPNETRDYLERLRADFSTARASGEDHRPFVTMPPDATVFEGVVGQITRLPSDTVDEVIQVYSLLSDIRVFANDLRSTEFSALPMDRREIALCDFFETRIVLSELADTALRSLDLAMGLGKRNGLFRTKVRNRASGQSDPKSDVAASENTS